MQGILQVSVSQFHLNKGNLNGAMILLGEGLGRIRNRFSEDLEIDLLLLCSSLESLLDKLHKNIPINKNDVPFLKKIKK